MNNKAPKCRCYTEVSDFKRRPKTLIIYCRLHRHAPKLLKALKALFYSEAPQPNEDCSGGICVWCSAYTAIEKARS